MCIKTMTDMRLLVLFVIAQVSMIIHVTMIPDQLKRCSKKDCSKQCTL